ncbi:MAG TPA: DUF881 domain-containing protein, partial [Natronosporangium sp.]
MTEPPNPFRPLSNDFLSELFRDPLDPGYADAARARAAGRQRSPARQLGLRATSYATLLVVGLLLAVAYQRVVAEEPTRAQIRADLEAQIHDRETETEALQARADQLRDEVAALRDSQLGDPEQVEQLRELEAATGLGRVSGDGVVVRVDDGPPGVDPQTGEPAVDPLARILDRDLQRIANALWAAGAEAIAINGRRLTATSTIRGASGAILIDRQAIAGPYEVIAVGPDDLRDRFAASETGQLMQVLVDNYGITYELRSAED